jgi:myo-inositol-1-phosphate synthase
MQENAMEREAVTIRPAEGRLLVLIPGLGAVATTFLAGLESVRRGLGRPLGSISQLQTIRLGPRSQQRNPPIRELLPLCPLERIAVAGWDVRPDDALTTARRAGVLDESDLAPVADFLAGIRPMQAAFEPRFARRLEGEHVKKWSTKRELVEALRDDIRQAIAESGAERAVMVWCASTEIYLEPAACHQSQEAFERGLDANDPAIAPSQLYAYAALLEGVPFANGAPNLTVDLPVFEQLAAERRLPIAGKDFKTGQTLLKTVLAPAFKARMLGVDGWFSTNILGNLDGAVLDDPDNFRSKEVSKTSVLAQILQPDLYPELYGELYHKVRINYYPPRGDAKESWDNIDIRGWMGYPMQIKVNFLCRDSILAAPIVLDLALFLDLAHRAGWHGVQEWLSFYFKSPHVEPGHVAENDVFIQHFRLKNSLRLLAGEAPLTHLDESLDG